MNYFSINLRGIFRVLSNFRLSFFLILCFILGGTSQDVVAPKLPLYLFSLVIIGACLMVLNRSSALWKLKGLMLIFGALFIGHLIYLIPLPPEIWSNLPGREFVAQGYSTLGAELPWLPLTMTPEKTLFSVFDYFPAIALVLMIGTVVSSNEIRLAFATIGIFGICIVILGIFQVSRITEILHFYSFTNEKTAVGFFSNSNHYGIFLLMLIPIAMCAFNYVQSFYQEEANHRLTFSIICIFASLMGIGASGSLGANLLIFPTLAAIFYIWSSSAKKKNIYLIGMIASIAAVFLFDMFVWGNLKQELLGKFTSIEPSTRQIMFENSYHMSKTFFPFGTGPGSFADVYRLVEQAGRKTIPHAHNDYIEMVSEYGIFGVFWMLMALIWIGKNIFKAMFYRAKSNRLAQYMSVCIVIPLIHSVFDYSLRTISVMTLFIFCLSILTLSNQNSLFEEK